MSETLEADTIRIRMYRVGFGDCFLLSLPLANSVEFRHILIDCGVHNRGNIGIIDDIVEHIALTTQKKLAIVIATHAHQDHISGFDSAKFGKFEIGEVWMPWTEDPKSPKALKLKKKHATLAAHLSSHFTAQASTSRQMSIYRAAASAAVANLVGNKSALQALHSGFGVNARVRFFEAGRHLKTVKGIPGLSVSILGPPTDEDFLARMDPPAGQRYLRLNNKQIESVNDLRPFPTWQVSPYDPLSDSEKKKLQEEVSEEALDGLAFSLDQAVNNTSLVTLLVHRGQHLLFPGDAQYGSWKFWLNNEDSSDVLSNISFLKVAHHGSHNATPKDALERMAPGKFAAMVSTQSTPWPSIPRNPLMDRLKQQTKNRVLRSDSLLIENRPDAPKGPPVSRMPKGFRRGDFWYDYLIKL